MLLDAYVYVISRQQSLVCLCFSLLFVDSGLNNGCRVLWDLYLGDLVCCSWIVRCGLNGNTVDVRRVRVATVVIQYY